MVDFFHDAAYRQLRLTALDEGTTNQDLLTEALNLLFKSRKRQTIA